MWAALRASGTVGGDGGCSQLGLAAQMRWQIVGIGLDPWSTFLE